LTGLASGRRTKFLVLVLWVVLTAVAVPLAGKLTDVQNNEAASWLPDSAEATAAFDRAQEAFPGSDKPVAVAVYARDSGLTGVDLAKAEADGAVFTDLAEGGQVSPGVPSEDGKALLISFPLKGSEDDQNAAVVEISRRLATDTPAGLQTALTGTAGAIGDQNNAVSGLDSTLLLVTAGVVALLLLLTYRSPVLWLIPLITVGVASQLASAAVYLLAKHAGLTVNLQSQSVLTVLVFGAGTDYALLLIARYREELRRHRDRHQAMAVALRRSFSAIVASAGTVAVGLLCLLAAQLNSTSGIGPVGALGVTSALLAAITVLPALLVLGGRWVFWPFVPRYTPSAVSHDTTADHGVWGRITRNVDRRPRRIWIGSAAALAALAFGASNLNLGLPMSQIFTTESGSVIGQRIIERHYPDGASSPVDILVAARAAEAVAAVAGTVDGVADVAPPLLSGDGRWARVSAVLAATPDSQAAKDTVDRLRNSVHAVPGADAVVGGETAVQLDIERASSRDNTVVMPLILAVVFLILIVLLRALIMPLLLIASVALSFAAALGAANLIFHAAGYPNIDFGLPLLAFLFLVALGVDYTIFLMTRAREEVSQRGHRRGVLHALAVTGGVITSAGLVLAATFSALTVLPLVPSLQMGVIVAVGVLLDTVVVRSLLVPALTIHIGPRSWWPSRLAWENTPAAQTRSPSRSESTRSDAGNVSADCSTSTGPLREKPDQNR
jgi:RND superfamily putative drug exporter